jgi:hypothetical protein
MTALVTRADIGGISRKFRVDPRAQSQGQKVGPHKPILRTGSFSAATRTCTVPEAEAVKNLGEHAVGFGNTLALINLAREARIALHEVDHYR